MSDVIPKEKQSAYERWEMTSFDEISPAERAAARARAAEAATQQTNNIAAMATQIEEAREEARAQGHAEGYAAGLEEGRAVGKTQLAQEKSRLQQIAETFGTEIAQANELIAVDMLDLSLDLAKAMLKTTLQVRPEVIVPVVREAIHYLPTLQQPALLHLHPDDAALIQTHMGDEITTAGWRIVEDMQMTPGGCRVETASNQVDATAETRWQRIAAALGKESEWLKS